MSTKTIVINLNTQEDWEWTENDEYIGRDHASRGLKASIFANPFPLTAQTNREEVLVKYHNWLWEQIVAGNITPKQILKLDGKRLACFCHPQACHGHVLQKAIIWAKTLDLSKTYDFSNIPNPIEMPKVRSLADLMRPLSQMKRGP